MVDKRKEKRSTASTVAAHAGGIGRAVGALAGEVVTFIPKMAAAGLYGIGKGVVSATTGKDFLTSAHKGVGGVQGSIQESLLTTPESQKYAEWFNKPFELINWPIEKSVAGFKGLAELATTGDIHKAAKVVSGESEGSSYLVPAVGSLAEANALSAMFGRPGFRHTKADPAGPKRLVPFAEHGALRKGFVAGKKYVPIGVTAVRKRLATEKGGFVVGGGGGKGARPGEPGFVERRQQINDIHRKKVDDMTLEEKKTALMTDKLTGLRNERAYGEAERMPHQASIDIDGLGIINKTYGTKAGDALLRKIGKALEEASDDQTRTYHFHGDEFALEGLSPGHMNALVRRAKEVLKQEPLEVTNIHTGEKSSFIADFTHGIAKTIEEADAVMHRSKNARKVTRGEAPISEDPRQLALQVENTFRNDPKGNAENMRTWIKSHDPEVISTAADLLMDQAMKAPPKEGAPMIAHAGWLKRQAETARAEKALKDDPHNKAIEEAERDPELAEMKASTEVSGPDPNYIVRESTSEGFKWDIIDKRTGEIVDQLTKNENPVEYANALTDKTYLPADKAARLQAMKEGAVEGGQAPHGFAEQAEQLGIEYKGMREMPNGETRAVFRDPESGRLFTMPKDQTMTPEMLQQARERMKATEEPPGGPAPPGGPPAPPGGPPAPPGGPPKPPGPPKSPLEKLTDSLDKVTKRKEPFSPIIKAKKSISRSTARVITGFQDVKVEASKIWNDFVREPVITKYEKVMGEYDLGKEVSGLEARKWGQKIQALVPKSLQEAVTNYIEARGDAKVLLERATESKNKEISEGYRKAAKLPEDIKLLADEVSAFFDTWLNKLQDAGVLGEQFIQDYVNHVWEHNPKMKNRMQAEIDTGMFRTNPALARKRIIESYFEGERLGLTPKNKGIGYLVTAYNKIAAEALYARKAVNELFEAKATDGQPVLVPDKINAKRIDSVEYRVVDPAGPLNMSGEVRAQRVFDTKGEALEFLDKTDVPDLVMVEKQRSSLIVTHAKSFEAKAAADGRAYRPAPDHPAIQKLVWSGKDTAGNPIFYRGSALVHPEAYKNLKNALSTSKIRATKVGKMALDVSSFAKQTLLSLSVFHPVQLGVHGIGHKVNLARLVEVDFKVLEQRNAVKSGLVTGFESGMQQFSEGLYGGGLIDRIPILGAWSRKVGDWTFQSYLPRLKMTMYLHALERNKKVYKGKLNIDQIRSKTAGQANSAFGGLNYRKMGRNKSMQDFLRLMTLAPDFLEARMRFAGESMRPFKHREQAAAMARLATGMFIAARVGNYMINDGNMHWERPFSLVINDQEYTLRSVPGDIMHLVVDPRSFIYHRLNPTIARTLLESLTGRDQYGKERGTVSQMKDFFITHIPIPLQGPFRKGEQKLWESALSSTGISTYKYKTPAERTMSRLIALNVPSKELSKEEAKFVRAKSKLKEAIREGTKLDPETIKEIRKLSPMQASKIFRDSTRFTRFQDGFKRLNIREGLKVFKDTRGLLGLNIDNDRQRYISAIELARKFRNAVKNNPHQLAILKEAERELLREAFNYLNSFN